jgi:hypothetical protein
MKASWLAMFMVFPERRQILPYCTESSVQHGDMESHQGHSRV